MSTRWSLSLAAALAIGSVGVVIAGQPAPSGLRPAFAVAHAVPGGQQAAQRTGGWTLPPDADKETNPRKSDPAAVDAGKQLFKKKCERCHGPNGKGDGPDGDPDHQEDMDLTRADRASKNPDGVIFYKVWNGRQKPKMPTFKDELTKDQVWALVTYVQTLRKQ